MLINTNKSSRLRYYLYFILIAVCSASFAQTSTQDIGWPRLVSKDGSSLVYYQPQINNWKDYKLMDAEVAFALTPKGKQEVHGVASVESGTLVDKDARTVYFKEVKLTSIRFPGVADDEAKKDENLVRALFPQGGEPFSLDRVLADMQQKNNEAPTVSLKNDPPPIFYSTQPSVLLIVDGDSVLAPVKKTDLEFVVNANWDLFFYKKEKAYYLMLEKNWMTARQLSSPWTFTATLPKDFSKLPDGENFDDVKKLVPPPASAGTVPRVLYTNKPGELIYVKGTPVYTRIPGTQLLYVSNTENNLFLEDGTKTFYVLLSGRWFSAKDLSGTWSYAGDHLPADFAKIPENNPKASVLSSVPGTIEAKDAVLLAQIPTTAVVNKKEAAEKVKVTYDGEPKFSIVEGTNLQYASNTQDKVIKVGDLYYLCFQAVWFMSTKPNGPWETATNVPDEIYKIPPSSPVYNVTYVTQTETSETTVQSSAGAGYFGAFILGVGVGACIAYGTGWYYPPYMWWGPGMVYPIYRPWPATYGAGFVYNPWTGGFAGGSRVYGPYGAAGTSAWYNPATGRYGRSASVQGWYGGRTAASTYNPWTGGYAATRQGHNPYAQWGTSVASRGNQWVQTGHVTTARGTTAGYRTASGQSGVIHSGANGTIAHGANGTVVGHDGNIYKKGDNGNWNQWSNGHWQQQVGGNGSTRKDLDNTAAARQRGQMQTQRFQNFRGPAGGGGFRGRRH